MSNTTSTAGAAVSEVTVDLELAEQIALKAIDLALLILGAEKVGAVISAKQVAEANAAADVTDALKFGPKP